MGLTNALVNKKNIFEYDKANVFWAGALLAALVYTFLYIIAPYISAFYEMPELTAIVRVGGLMVVISPLSVVPRAVLMRDLEFKKLALVNLVIGLVGTALALTLAIYGWGYWALILSTVIAQALELVILFSIAAYLPTRPSRLNELVPMFKYGLNILGARLVAVLNKNWPTIVISYHVGKTHTGYFQMANTLAGLPMTKIGEIFTKIAFPAFSVIQDDIERSKQVFLSMHKYLFMVVAPMFVGIALTAEEFIPILVGEKWLDIVVPLQLICLANIFSGSGLLIPHMFEGLGDAKSSFRYELLITFISPIALLVAVPWGFEAMLFAWAVSVPISYTYLLNKLFKSTGMKLGEFLGSISMTGLALLFMIPSILLVDFYMNGIAIELLLALKVVVAIISFALVYLTFGKHEIVKLINIFRTANEVS